MLAEAPDCPISVRLKIFGPLLAAVAVLIDIGITEQLEARSWSKDSELGKLKRLVLGNGPGSA